MGYWSGIQAGGVAVSVVAAIAGAVIVSGRNTVFATGVMVALALVPSAAIAGLGLVTGSSISPWRRWGAGRWRSDAW